MPSKLSNVVAPAFAYSIVAGCAYLLSNYALAYMASNVVFTLLSVATITVYASRPFRGLISNIGLILALS